jgi:hypothetical protein
VLLNDARLGMSWLRNQVEYVEAQRYV